MKAKKPSARKRVKPVSDAIVNQGIALLRDPRVSKRDKRQLTQAAFAGIQTGEISFTQLRAISRA